MDTISFSVDKETKDQIIKWAKAEKKSRSDILREMTRQYDLQKRWAKIQKISQTKAREFNLQTDEDIEKFLG